MRRGGESVCEVGGGERMCFKMEKIWNCVV